MKPKLEEGLVIGVWVMSVCSDFSNNFLNFQLKRYAATHLTNSVLVYSPAQKPDYF